MLGKLLKSIRSPSLKDMKIGVTQSRSGLSEKLHLLTEQLINSAKPFHLWVKLNSQNCLHVTLQQIYNHCIETAQSEQSAVAIYQFYTLILLNCNDQLLICKLVSDDFIIQLARMQSTSNERVSGAICEELEPYRVNLIKAYLATVTHEVVKYMVVQDEFKVFRQCVYIYSLESLGIVEKTTIGNCILNVMKNVDALPFLWQSVWEPQSLELLYKQCIEKIYNIIIKLSQQPHKQHSSNTYPQLEQTILFICQIQSFINKPSIKHTLNEFFIPYFEELIELLTVHYLQKIEGEQCPQSMQLLRQRLVKIVSLVQNLLDCHGASALLVSRYLDSEVFMAFMQLVIEEEVGVRQATSKGEENEKRESSEEGCLRDQTISHPKQIITEKLYRCILILAKYIHYPSSCLSCREQTTAVYSQQILTRKRCRLLQLFVPIIEYLNLHISRTENSKAYLVGFFKCLFNAIIELKLALQSTASSDQSVTQELKLHLLRYYRSYIQLIKQVLKKNEQWDQIIGWYENGTSQVASHLLRIPQHLEINSETGPKSIILAFENLRNYRFMIVEETTLQSKFIKQQKMYHSTFFSKGMSYEPATLIKSSIPSQQSLSKQLQPDQPQPQPDQPISIVCPGTLHHNHQQIPIVIIEDKQCLIFAMKVTECEPSQTVFRILINVKFKDIEGFTYGNTHRTHQEHPKFITVNLKGTQQINLEFANSKVHGNVFRDYLIRSRNSTRQRQLKFINMWLREYESDTDRSIKLIESDVEEPFREENVEELINKQSNLHLRDEEQTATAELATENNTEKTAEQTAEQSTEQNVEKTAEQSSQPSQFQIMVSKQTDEA